MEVGLGKERSRTRSISGVIYPGPSPGELRGWAQPAGKSFWGGTDPARSLEGARSPPGGAASLFPCQLPPPSPLQPWLGGCDAFGHGPSPGCPPRPRRAEGTPNALAVQFPARRLPAPTSACPLPLSAPPADCRGNPGCSPPQRTSLGGGTNPALSGINPAPLAPAGAGARLPSAPSHPPNPCGFAGAWAGGSPPSFPPLQPSFFLPVPVCLPEPRSPLSPTPLPVSARGDAISLSDSLQMDVVYTFQTGASSLQGALRRQPSIVSQHHDVKNVSSPTHVALSSVNSTPTTSAVAAAAASPPAGSE